MAREFPTAPVVGVGAVIIDEDQRVLLVLRGQQPLQGEWSLPGGVLELGETLEAGLRREIAEETGITVKIQAVVEVLDKIVLTDQNEEPEPAAPRIRFHYVLIDFLCLPTGGMLHSGTDALAARWIPREELKAFALAPVTESVIDRAFSLLPQVLARRHYFALRHM